MRPFSAVKNRFLSLSTGQRCTAIIAPICLPFSMAWIYSESSTSAITPGTIANFFTAYFTFTTWLTAKPGRAEQLVQREAKREIARRQKEETNNREAAPMLTRICLSGGAGLALVSPFVYNVVSSQLPTSLQEGAQTVLGGTVLIPVGVIVGCAVNSVINGTARVAKKLSRHSTAVPMS